MFFRFFRLFQFQIKDDIKRSTSLGDGLKWSKFIELTQKAARQRRLWHTIAYVEEPMAKPTKIAL
jgi:hypothetical protein